MWHAADGDHLSTGQTVMELTGSLRPILTAERTALNFLGHLSGIATLTAAFVAAAHAQNASVQVLDTRKTTPGLRVLEKAAVRAGGGTNHRAGLSDGVLVKDNHLAGTGITAAVRRARELWPERTVEVECDGLEQVDADASPDESLRYLEVEVTWQDGTGKKTYTLHSMRMAREDE